MKKLTLKNDEILTIRVPEKDDVQEIVDYLNLVGGESDNLLFGKNEFHMTVEKEEEYVESMKSDQNKLMIIGIIGDEIASIAQISGMNRMRVKHNGEIAISVRKKHWRKGVGEEMMKELIQFGENNNIMKNITLGVKEDNTGAIGLYEKLGFNKVGVISDYFNINDKYFDKYIMEKKLKQL